MTIKFLPLEEYRNALRGFDWLYDYSDDYTVWAAAKQQFNILWDQARLSDDHMEVWREVQAERRAQNEKAGQ